MSVCTCLLGPLAHATATTVVHLGAQIFKVGVREDRTLRSESKLVVAKTRDKVKTRRRET